MSRVLITVAAVFATRPFMAMAQSAVNQTNVTAGKPAHEVHSSAKDVKSTAQYKELVGYYQEQYAIYSAKAAAEKIECERRAQVNAGLAQKYPRPVDSAKYLWESYSLTPDKAALEAQHYQ